MSRSVVIKKALEESSIKTKTDNLDVLLSTRASESTLSGIKTKTDNLDVLLSSRASENKLNEVVNKLTQPTTIYVADISVTTTATALFSTSTPSRSAVLLADANNTDKILVGNSTSQLFPLSAGASLKTEVSDLAVIYVKAVSGTQILHVIREV